ncbi:MAG: hypothetical protein SFT94_09595 [Pseudanabaenaceae cyanobacterium bins.68]|nr:hypothetical protein [Pseudanabaenaceae cyanobacterium bins.68]
MVRASWQDIPRLRQFCEQELRIKSGEGGRFWLPLVLSARGLLFGEVIARLPDYDQGYYQPLDLTDNLRQPLYRLGRSLLTWIEASPGVYLVQFDLHWSGKDWQLQFDQVLPFPDRPAIASVGVQTPDLFECHLTCLRGEPLRDLVIAGRDYLVLEGAGLVMVPWD